MRKKKQSHQDEEKKDDGKKADKPQLTVEEQLIEEYLKQCEEDEKERKE